MQLEDAAIAEITDTDKGYFIDIGDTNGDGVNDYGLSQNSDRDESYHAWALVFLGPLAGAVPTNSAETRVRPGTADSDACCFPKAGDDADGDGYADVLIGNGQYAPDDSKQPWAGARGLLATLNGPLSQGDVDMMASASATFVCEGRDFLGTRAALLDVTADGVDDVTASSSLNSALGAIVWAGPFTGRLGEAEAVTTIDSDHDVRTVYTDNLAIGDVDNDGNPDLLMGRKMVWDDPVTYDTLIFLGPF